MSTEAFGLFVGAVPIGIAVLLDAVCHRLEPRDIGSVALFACRRHHVHIHVHIHRHVHAFVRGECGAIEIKGGERVVACLAAEVLVQGKTKANNTTLCCASILDDARQRQNKESDGDTHDERVGLLIEAKLFAICSECFQSGCSRCSNLQYIHESTSSLSALMYTDYHQRESTLYSVVNVGRGHTYLYPKSFPCYQYVTNVNKVRKTAPFLWSQGMQPLVNTVF